ncbi:MAG: hypothetical protein M1821_008259 [Bathelium mastoideum]|nr:MAG: hypothetical protein M1821_008259 [Bathelium mastoideum]
MAGLPSAMLLDPKAYVKAKATANGTADPNFLIPPSSSLLASGRATSAPPALDSLPSFPFSTTSCSPDTTLDDIALTLKGKSSQVSAKSIDNEATMSITSSFIDPKMLLNPKGALKRERETPGLASQPELDNAAGSELRPTTELGGMGGMIERMHNVGKREDAPRKRVKSSHIPSTEEEPDGRKAKPNFNGTDGRGVVGDYVKTKREEGLNKAGPQASVVDLTNASDDEVVFVRDSGDTEVCLGSLTNSVVRAHLVPTPKKEVKGSMWPHIPVTFSRLPLAKDSSIEVLDPTGTRFGKLDIRTSSGLAPILDGSSTNKLRLLGELQPRKKILHHPPGHPVSENYYLHITLVAPKKMAPGLGKFLSQKQLYLHDPNMALLKLHFKLKAEVLNPHKPKDHTPREPVLATTYSYSNGKTLGPTSGFSARTAEEIQRDVNGMFDKLTSHENLPLRDTPARIATDLMPHQKQGLYFMAEKERLKEDGEDDCFWQQKQKNNGATYYQHVLTGIEMSHRPHTVQGGILADMMGLGKTLSVLSLIVDSLDAARLWSHTPVVKAPDSNVQRNARTTLLVVPVSTVANWEEQIKLHIKPSTVNYYIYHGSNRSRDLQHLSSYDMVITTYNVVSTEYDGRKASALELIKWFRIVLDEAHIIREQSTKQSKAICALPAQRRWAVTGTPIQNRLDDFGALVKFLRIEPFADVGEFKRNLLTPLKSAEEGAMDRVRLLVDSITLRRMKDKIDLPPRHDEVHRLDMSDRELALHEAFAQDSRQLITRMAVNNDKKGIGAKNYVRVLRCILRMRQVCAAGSDLLNDEDMQALEGLNPSTAIDLGDEDDEDKPVLSIKQVVDMLSLVRELDEDRCAYCKNKIRPGSAGFDESGNASRDTDAMGHMTPCFHVICPSCYPAFLENVGALRTSDGFMTCPICKDYVRANFFALNESAIAQYEETEARLRSDPRLAKRVGRYSGPSTKTKVLLEELDKARLWSIAHPNEAPIKSVIFSGWTNHLDLIQIALEERGYTYVRLDGRMQRKQRAISLATFRDDPSVHIILVSIGAGGLGLNLTSASQAFVMEPQFNPAAEAQAVDRIHRLGQKRPVTIVRFIMRNSFEEKMRELQEKKMRIADLTLMGESEGKGGAVGKRARGRVMVEELKALFGSAR